MIASMIFLIIDGIVDWDNFHEIIIHQYVSLTINNPSAADMIPNYDGDQ